MKRTLLLTMPCWLALTACETSYNQFLSQQLDGQPKEQQRLIVAGECRQEIEKGLIRDDPENIAHHEVMQRICEEMTGKPVEIGY